MAAEQSTNITIQLPATYTSHNQPLSQYPTHNSSTAHVGSLTQNSQTCVLL